jgi:gliding motility-associated-like protein
LIHRILLISLALLFNLGAFSQQGNVWYFGENAGLDFNYSPPKALINGQLNTQEGCSSIADSTGKLLFYTDGSVIYNRNHQPMPNGSGLLGDFSSSQSAIIIAKPGSNNIYYVFTAPVHPEYLNGYNYSVVDMNLNSGMGDVSQKNIPLYSSGSERLAAVRHADGASVWVLTKKLASNEFRVYKIDCNGLNTTPVVSFAGTVLKAGEFADGGLLKISSNGKFLCQTTQLADDFFELYQFDNNTGKVFNPIKIPVTPPTYIRATGSYNCAEFSPNSMLLYINQWFKNPADDLFYMTVLQYDVSNYNYNSITTSIVKILEFQTGPEPELGMMQLAPDQKIYVIRVVKDSLDVINNPNIKGIGCNYESNAVSLQGRLGLYGLPTYMANLFADKLADISYTSVDNCSSFQFKGTTTLPGPLSWNWNFDDGSTSTEQNPAHIFPVTKDSFNVTLRVTSSSCIGSVSTTKKVLINSVRSGFNIQSACDNKTVSFINTSSVPVDYRVWDFGDGTTSTDLNPQHTYANWGNYSVILKTGRSNSCNKESSLTKLVKIGTTPIMDFSFDKPIYCADELVQFNNNSNTAFGTITNWQWQFGDGLQSIEKSPAHYFAKGGNLQVKLTATTDYGCSNSDTKNITIIRPNVNAGNDTTILKGTSIILNGSGAQTYTWNPPDYLSNNNIAQPLCTPDKDIVYRLRGTENGCGAFDSVKITVINDIAIFVPNAFTPKGNNPVLKPILRGFTSLEYFTIYNRWGQRIFTTNQLNKGWDGTLNGQQQNAAVYTWILKAKDVKGRVWTQRGTVILLH